MNKILISAVAGAVLGLAALRLPARESPEAAADQRQKLSQYALEHGGDAQHGRELFFNENRLACVSCHDVAAGTGRRSGPNLAGVADRRDRADLIRKLLEPSSSITPGWQRVTVTTKAGQVLTGRLQNQVTDDFLEILVGGGNTVRVAKIDLEAYRLETTSAMPVGLVDDLSPEEFADLIEFLLSLRSQGK
jgi:putative heme-binding domain-containing protein